MVRWALCLCSLKNSSQQPYKVSELLNDFKASFWGGLEKHKPIDANTRNLQILHIDGLTNVLQVPDQSEYGGQTYYRLNSVTVHPLVRLQLQSILHEIDHALPGYKDPITRDHLQEMRRLIKEGLDPEGSSKKGGDDHSGHSHLNGIDDTLDLLPLLEKRQEGVRGCWESDDEIDY